jgi:hypothetical protein
MEYSVEGQEPSNIFDHTWLSEMVDLLRSQDQTLMLWMSGIYCSDRC